ncbi:hypothetical protein N7495_003819 [Penicillium taxi]|uniref:uncharacterized protein n=1 Tax=Penicillium taxi TaxID=168475 RepID=UPI002545696B|nr:uncharacterized protein N7495_003819 [Penicillium taxi]KAJ5899075.1 hypothetical protein N7495_003819 [Penicillium taxi]
MRLILKRQASDLLRRTSVLDETLKEIFTELEDVYNTLQTKDAMIKNLMEDLSLAEHDIADLDHLVQNKNGSIEEREVQIKKLEIKIAKLGSEGKKQNNSEG